MRELNPIGRDQDQLLLVASDGERFSVLIDDTLTKTLKEHRLPDTNAVQLSPREIQDAIRSGATVTELAESSGGSVDLIERFAHPVLEELAHMVDMAKSIRIELPADRFNDIEKKPFGEVVEGKLAQTGAEFKSWSAKRGENTIWEISVHFEQGGTAGFATWTFDPRRYLLTPETANAASLSTPSLNLDSPLGGSPRVTPSEAPKVEASVVTADKLEAFRKRRELATSEVEIVEVVEISNEVAEIVVEEATAIYVEEELEQEVPVFEIVDEPVLEEVEEPATEDLGEEPQEAPVDVPVSEPKRSRPPMPSWDQIVRGTQSDDGEAF
ncbi:MAG: hypothetical protein RLZZ380_972 [Actinomycetota bacterium]|jgi:hypothetical protein